MCACISRPYKHEFEDGTKRTNRKMKITGVVKQVSIPLAGLLSDKVSPSISTRDRLRLSPSRCENKNPIAHILSEGKPAPSVTWKRAGGEVEGNVRTTRTGDITTSVLTLDPLRREHHNADFICESANDELAYHSAHVRLELNRAYLTQIIYYVHSFSYLV